MDSFVFTRHTSDCRYKRDRLYRRCNCPKWVEGRFNSERIRKSASTRLWDEAEQFRQRLEETLASGRPLSSLDSNFNRTDEAPVPAQALSSTETSVAHVLPSATFPEQAQPSLAPHGEALPQIRQKARITIQKGVEVYMADARSRNLQTDTVKKLERLFEKQFLPWSRTEGLVYLDELDHNALLTFRTTWTEGLIVKAKKQDRVVGFFWECFRRGFITQNPALSLSKIRPRHIPTDYFPRDEFNRIIDAIAIYGDPRGGYLSVEDTRTRLRTLTLLMRWSGLRIRDAVTLERHRLEGDNLLLYQAKTGHSVYVPLPPEVVAALVHIPEGPVPNKRYFFWSGNGLPKSAVANWQRSFRRLFHLANIRKLDGHKKRCHPHMFRDTFAVEMLLAGVPIDQVSTLLGHSSVKVTERHYAPFVKARQLQLQASVRAAWKIDGILGHPIAGAPNLHAPAADGVDGS